MTDQRNVKRSDNHQHRRVIEKSPHHQKGKLHQDQDDPGIEPQLLGEQIIDGPDRAQPVEDRPKSHRCQNDPHEHAGDRQGLADRGFKNLLRHPSFEYCR